ncbi:MAG: hypothetical protein AAF802_05625 [Planctomycetota bacterium]
MSKTNRRNFCGAAAAIVASSSTLVRSATASAEYESFVPCRALTRGPFHHWFGYYDKREFDASNRRVLANRVGFEGRSPTAEDEIKVGFIDTEKEDEWNQLGSSRAWGWQQGCMLQWLGGERDEVLWNDREGDSFVCRVHSVTTGKTRTLPKPIYTVSPDGKFGLAADFRRINNLRPGYGYSGLADPHVEERAPEESGVWKIDLATGASKLIFSIKDAASIPWEGGERRGPKDAWHYFNHLLISPDSSRFIVLHRYRPAFDPKTLQFEGGFVTRMFTADTDGSDRYVLDPSGYTSHFIWKDEQVVTMWTRPQGAANSAFYEFVDRTRKIRPLGTEEMKRNGHNTYLPAPYTDWILNDTYPDAKTRRQTVYLYHVPSQRRFDLGHFTSPPQYRGEWRCDTHPRSSNDGRQIAIDSPHQDGRQVYLLDIGELLDRES